MFQQQQYLGRGVTRLLVVLCLAPALAFAQQPPDAGTILREQPKPPAIPAQKPAAPAVEKPAAKPEAEGPRVRVTAIRVQGNTLIPEAELVARVSDLVGREVSFRELHNATTILIGIYAARGYVARVFLPPQEIRDGVVLFQVVEGVRGNLNIRRDGERVDEARVRRFIEERTPAGKAADVGALGEAVAILNEQPGVEASSALAPGMAEREIDVNVAVKDRPLTAFSLGLNNHGSRATGALQANAGFALANPTGHFDAASLLVNVSDGTTFGRGEYSLALGHRGLRFGLNASALRYRLTQSAFAALQSNGTAETFGLTASYPLARRGTYGLSLAGGAETRKLVDRTVAGETSNREVRVANAGLGGHTALPENIGGVLTFGAGLTVGETDQHNPAALAADQLARRTQGGFAKLGWNLGWIRPLDSDWTVTASLRGQQASKNLDSSERFALGGVSGIRAYPASEATGDSGFLFNGALTRKLGNALGISGFIDAGHITLNHTVPPAGIATPNRYTLSGAGLSLDWQPTAQSVLSVVLARPIGNNPGRDINGLNADGTRSNSARAWLNFAAQF